MTVTKSIFLAAGLALLTASCGSDAESSAKFCDAVTALSSLDVTANLDLEAEDPGAAMSAAFSEMTDIFDELEASAPAEIKDDLALLNEGVTTLTDALDEADGDLFALASDPEMAERLEALESPEFEQAADNIEAYTSSECGVSLS